MAAQRRRARRRSLEGGFDLERVLSADDLVSGDDVFVAATGVTGGSLLRGVRASATGVETESIVMRSRSGTVRRISAFHPNDKLANLRNGGLMAWDELYETARAIVADDKGILAADESTGTIEKRFDAIGVESTEETRRAYRNLLFTTAGHGGVHRRRDPLRRDDPPARRRRHAVRRAARRQGSRARASRSTPGAKPLALHPGETVTEGLDGLRERLAEYYELGARFAKWRAVITIGDGIPTDACIHANAHALARYAALCQEAGLVPIVEPEVLMDADNTIETCDDVTGRTLRALYAALYAFDVHLRGTLLKPNMVIAGKGCPEQAPTERIADADGAQPAAPRARARAGHRVPLRRPERGAGDREPERDQPRSAARGRSRTRTAGRCRRRALEAWRGEPANVEAAQAAFLHRARMNSDGGRRPLEPRRPSEA